MMDTLFDRVARRRRRLVVIAMTACLALAGAAGPARGQGAVNEALDQGRLFTARSILQQGASENRLNPVAAYALARMLKEGLGGEKDPARARQILKALAELPYRQAKVDYALMLQRGEGGPADPAAAIPLLVDARNAGDARAAVALGRAYARGEGVAFDPVEAFAHLVLAALNKQPEANAVLGEMISRKRITREQMAAGDERRKAIIAEIQRGIENQPANAIDGSVDFEPYVKAAAERAYEHYDAEQWDQAFRIYMDLADADPIDGESAFYVARMHERGWGVEANQAAAVHWYTQAVLSDIPVAAFNLGYMYDEGRGVPRADRDAANALFEAAAYRGWWNAMIEAADRMLSGTGYESFDPVEAGAFLRIAAEDGRRTRAIELLREAREDGVISQAQYEKAGERADAIREAVEQRSYGPPPLHLMLRTYRDGSHATRAPHHLAPAPVGAAQPGARIEPVEEAPTEEPGATTFEAPAEATPAARGGAAAPMRRPDDARAGTITLEPFAVRDAQMGGMPAYRGMKPEGWKLLGGIVWAPHMRPFVNPYFSLVGDNGMEVSVLGGHGYSFSQSTPALAAQLRNQGYREPEHGSVQANGSIYMPPPSNVAELVTRVLMPAGRPKAQRVRVVGVRDMPRVREALEAMMAPMIEQHRRLAATARTTGSVLTPFELNVGAVTVEYVEEGVTYREEVSAYYFQSRMSAPYFGSEAMHNWTWFARGLGAVRAPASEFERYRPLLLAVLDSVQRTPQWGLRIDAMQAQLMQAENAARQRGLADRQRMFEQTQAKIREANDATFEALRSGYEQRQAAKDRMQHEFMNTVHEVDDYEMPDGSNVSVPANYNHYYTDGARVIMSNQAIINDSGLEKIYPATSSSP